MSVIDNCCGSPCNGEGTPNEPCYGTIDVIDEMELGEDDWAWVHGCDGHTNWPGAYVPEPPVAP